MLKRKVQRSTENSGISWPLPFLSRCLWIVAAVAADFQKPQGLSIWSYFPSANNMQQFTQLTPKLALLPSHKRQPCSAGPSVFVFCSPQPTPCCAKAAKQYYVLSDSMPQRANPHSTR